jgi:Phosphotransferase enzyme family
MSEETLPGGNTDGAVRIGGVVHKRASPWTPTVHALLRHLEYADVDGVPRALGFDDQGRQMPQDERWFTGRTMQPGWIVGHQDAAPYNAVMDGDRLVGFFDWDTASPSPRDDDLAFSALLWVPLTAPNAGVQSGSHDVRDRSCRLHLLLDAYRYDGDRRGFGAVTVQRARRQAGVIRGMADAGDRAAIALLPIASRLEQSASYVEALPGDSWMP